MDTATLILNVGSQLRGAVINQTIFLERQMDEYLSLYYCYTLEKQAELFDLLLGEKLSFDAKRNAIVYLLTKHKEEFLKENPTLDGNLSRIMKKRNLLAHSLLDTSAAGIKHFEDKKEIRFVKFNNQTEYPVFNNESVAKLIDDIEKCITMMVKLNQPLQTPPA